MIFKLGFKENDSFKVGFAEENDTFSTDFGDVANETLSLNFNETDGNFAVGVDEEKDTFSADFGDVKVIASDNFVLKTDETLSFDNGVLSVNRAHEPEPNNTLPITAAAVATTVGNIEILLQKI